MNDIIINCKKCENNYVIGYLSDYLDSEEIQQLDTYDFKQPLPQRLKDDIRQHESCLLYTSPSPRDGLLSRMPSSA